VTESPPEEPGAAPVPLATIARDWTRIGLTGFGGPPAHVVLLRRLVVERRGWMDAHEFEDANAACGLLPGPASTQLAIFCAYRVGGPLGAVVGGLGFVLPAVVLVLALAMLFFGSAPPLWVRGAGAGAGAAVAAVALDAARTLLVPSYERVRADAAKRLRWAIYLAAAAAGAALIGPYLVLVLLGCGLAELAIQRGSGVAGVHIGPLAAIAPATLAAGGLGALCWTAFKVGALSYGGGFVIIPLMQGDAVHTYHWMTDADFVNAVALGQITPGPVVATIAAVGYAAHGLAGGMLAAVVAFTPSFSFILLGGARFGRLRESLSARAFLAGAGPAAIGAIAGACVPLVGALSQWWQYPVLAAAVCALLLLRRSVVAVLLCAGAVGVLVALAGGPLP
jgi:chromate transporter